MEWFNQDTIKKCLSKNLFRQTIKFNALVDISVDERIEVRGRLFIFEYHPKPDLAEVH
jgi:hypothetical protein